MSTRPPLDPSELQYRSLDPAGDEALVDGFFCEDDDLDDFIRTDAFRFQSLNVAHTYLGFVEGRLVGFFTLATDAIRLSSTERKKTKRNGEGLRHNDHPFVPAIKLARIGVCSEFKAERSRVGTHLVRVSCFLVLNVAETVGCRFLTVDAYQSAIGFYEKLGFVPNKDKEYQNKLNPSMRLDLMLEDGLDWLWAP